jgi:hypothetical protein
VRPYADRKAARIERLRARAERLQAEGERRVGSAAALADRIPMGQPILVGHHSEKRARRDAQRIHDGLAKGYALQKEAADLERRAGAAEENRAISSDDPEAVRLLREKLAEEVAFRDRWKAINAALRREDTDALAVLKLTGKELTTIGHAVCGTGFVVTNASANIRRIEKRIAELEAQAARPAREPLELGDITIDEVDNRTRIHFPGRPSKLVIEQLRHGGFIFCRSDSCWQRRASEYAWQLARGIAERAQSAGRAA